MKAWTALFATTAIAVPVAAIAQPVRGAYVSLGAGADLLQNETYDLAPQLVQDLPGRLLPTRLPDGRTILVPGAPVPGDPHKSIRLDPGFSGQVSAGWGFGNGLRVEIEGNYANTHISGVNEGLDQRAGGYEQQYGGFLNVLYDFNLGLPVYPYVGLGAGGQELDTVNLNSSQVGFQFPRRGGDQMVGAFAYQAIAGFAVPVPWIRGLSFTTEYRFIGLLDPLTAATEQRISGITHEQLAVGNAKIGNVFNHNVLIGLRYEFGARRAPPAPPPPVIPAAPAPAPARTYLVFFDWDRATLTERARQIVADAAQASTRVQTTRIAVNGYTDRSGTVRYNQVLSVRRAESVADELVHDGVARQDIAIEGFGETHPLVPTADGVREPQNRRVEIILM